MWKFLYLRFNPVVLPLSCFFWLFFLFSQIGKMKGLAFVQDPDGYWIEILNPKHMVTLT